LSSIRCSTVDLGDQLALAVAGTQFDRAVGLRRRTVGEISDDVLLLSVCSVIFGFAEYLSFQATAWGENIALAVVHEGLFFGGPVVLQLFTKAVHVPAGGRKSPSRWRLI